MPRFQRHHFFAQVLSDLKRNLTDIPEADPQHFQVLFETAKSSILAAADPRSFSSRILTLGIDGLTAQRATQIALSLTYKAAGRMERMHQQRLFITKAVWRSSGVPCLINPLKPSKADRRVAAAHRAADGKVYDIAHGLKIKGRYIWPGEEWCCHCYDRWLPPRHV